MKVVPINTKLVGPAQRTTQTRLELMEITTQLLDTWRPAPFQRPLKVNQRVLDVADAVKRDGVIPGVVTIGVLDGVTYVLDAQHRLHAFRMAKIPGAYADVRVHHFDNIGAMGDEFVRLNSMLVQFRPDDILRGLEGSHQPLQRIRQACPYVGYDMIRRGDRAPLCSMAVTLRCWRGSTTEVPGASPGSAQHIATTLLDEEAEEMIGFLQLVYRAWGRDHEYARLWSGLNLTLAMWLYRRVVLTPPQERGLKRATRFTKALFEKCMMSLSAEATYIDWLAGRSLRESDRSPAYGRLTAIVKRRYFEETGKKPLMPQPAWFGRSRG